MHGCTLQDLTISLQFYWCTLSRTCTKTGMICRGLRPKMYFIVGNIWFVQKQKGWARWAPGWCSNVIIG
jgi:hypothetical protein